MPETTYKTRLARLAEIWFPELVAAEQKRKGNAPVPSAPPTPNELKSAVLPRLPDDPQTLLLLLRKTAWSLPTLLTVRTFLTERLLAKRSGWSKLSLEQVDAAHERELAAWMRARVFGANKPSVSRFRTYLRELHGATLKGYAECREAARSVNFWKQALKVELVYQGRRCTLGVTRPRRDEGEFQLREPGSERGSLYNNAIFPPLDCRRVDLPRTS